MQERSPELTLHNLEPLRVDALDKVVGKTRYTTDMPMKNAVYVRMVRSPYPHAGIRRIDTTEATRLQGVIRAVTARDVPGANQVGFFIQDQTLLCDERARFIGDVVAMIVADSPEAAQRGVEAVKVEYDQLPAVFDPEEALREGAVKLHETGNLLDRQFVRKGDVERGFREADVVVRGTYRTPIQEHAYLETEAALAFQADAECMTVVGSMQCPFAVEKAVKLVLGKSVTRVRIIQAPTGGGFGGKEDAPDEVCARAALAALLTKRPALLAFSRQESVLFHPKRHPMTIKREMGLSKDGKITAVRAHVLVDGGAYASLSSRVLFQATCLGAGAYEVPNVFIDGVVAYTNNVPMGAFRGFGKPQTFFAAEMQMDEAADSIGMDPLELRRKNLLREGSTTATGQVLGRGVGLEECLSKAAAAASWENARSSGSTGSTLRRGIGMACIIHPTSLGPLGVDIASATVEVTDDESVVVRTGLTEYGQGLYTGYVSIVRKVLGLKKTVVRVELPDTAVALDSGPTVASRGTAMGGKALLIACEKLRNRLAGVAAELLACSAADVAFESDSVYAVHSPGKSMSFIDLVARCKAGGVQPKEDAWHRATGISWDKAAGQGSPWTSYSFGVHVAEVQVDVDTGKVDLLKYIAAHDSGRVLVQTQFTSQIYGGVVQGLGYALMEELLLEKGRMLNPSFLDYYIPTAADVPIMVPLVVEAPDDYGPYGAKGIGEPPIEPVAAAVGNAIYNALGFPIREFPYTSERVHSAITSRKQGG